MSFLVKYLFKLLKKAISIIDNPFLPLFPVCCITAGPPWLSRDALTSELVLMIVGLAEYG